MAARDTSTAMATMATAGMMTKAEMPTAAHAIKPL